MRLIQEVLGEGKGVMREEAKNIWGPHASAYPESFLRVVRRLARNRQAINHKRVMEPWGTYVLHRDIGGVRVGFTLQ